MQPIFAIYFLWILWFLAWIIATLGPVTGVRRLKLHEEFLYRCTTIAATGLLFTLTPWPGLDVQYRLWQRSLADETSWRIVATTAGALGFSWWALLHRIKVFGSGDALVTTGPYRILRHPIYGGLIIALFATATLLGKPSSVAGAAIFAAAFSAKAITEERRTEGTAFDAYKERAWMFIPVIGLIWHFLSTHLRPPAATARSSAPIFTSPAVRQSPPGRHS